MVNLSQFDKKRIAVVMTIAEGQPQVFCGTANYERQGGDGGRIRIQLEGFHQGLGRPVLMLHEQEWREQIEPDTQYGCDYCIQLKAAKFATGK